MAGIGLYGVFYSKCKKVDGVTIGYEGGVKMMGKAISAAFERNSPDENPLYANNGKSENDISTGSGGTLTMTLDRMTLETAADLYGTDVKEITVQVDGEQVNGKEIVYKGEEVSAPIGAAYIKLQQEDGVREHEVVFYREMSMTPPGEEAETMGESIEWQTPEVEATVAGMQGDGSEPWYRAARFPTLKAALVYTYQLFGEVYGGEAVGV